MIDTQTDSNRSPSGDLGREHSFSDLSALRRDPKRAVFSGLCAGIANRTGYDALLIRTLVVILGFSGGFGVVAYLALSAVTPLIGETKAPLDGFFPKWRKLNNTELWQTILGISFIFGLIVTLSLDIDLITPFGWGTVALLFGAWIVAAQLQKRTNRTHAQSKTAHLNPNTETNPFAYPPPSTTPQNPSIFPPPDVTYLTPNATCPSPNLASYPPPDAAYLTINAPTSTQASVPYSRPGAPVYPPSSIPPNTTSSASPAKPRSLNVQKTVLVLVTLGLASITWLSAYSAYHGTERRILAGTAALFVISIGLIFGAKFGRSIILILTGLFLTLNMMLNIFLPFSIGVDGDAKIRYNYTSAADLPTSEIALSNNQANLDFSELVLTESTSINITIHNSAVRIVMPDPNKTRALLLAHSSNSVIITKNGRNISIANNNKYQFGENENAPTLTINLESSNSLALVKKS